VGDEQRSSSASDRSGAGSRGRDDDLAPTCSPAAAWLLWFVFRLNSLYLQVELNKVVDRYAGASAGITVPLIV
jgi:hypothetical protein